MTSKIKREKYNLDACSERVTVKSQPDGGKFVIQGRAYESKWYHCLRNRQR